tara:strand:- start:4655 stop:5269 length:615 start_codon:yes stop_codon:yes gene_type:complete
MCGVVGYSSQDPIDEHYSILHKLIYQSKIRGLHSFGYSYCLNNKLTTRKYHNVDEVVLPQANKIVFHNRYATSGDYQDHINNQPITNNNLSLVFNGVLDMRTKVEMELHYGIKMQTYNDGEIILQKCGANKDLLKDYIGNIKGSFAGLILTASNELLAIRNSNRPLWRLSHSNAIFYASTKDIFKRVDKSFQPEQLKPNQLYED